MTENVSLPIRIVNTDNEVVTFECKIWICDGYLVDPNTLEGDMGAAILIGNEFLRNHRLGIEWGEEGTRDFLRYRGKEGSWLFPCLSHEESHET